MMYPYWSNDIQTKQSTICNQIFETAPVLESLWMVYFSIAHSIISYDIIFWGSSAHTKIIFKIRKRVIRIIDSSGNWDSCRDLFREFSILPFQSQHTFSLFMFAVTNKDFFSKRTRMFILSIRDSIMIYIFQWYIWSYFRKEYGILVLNFTTIFHQPSNNYHMIFLNLKCL
jgi:hypothetical protein